MPAGARSLPRGADDGRRADADAAVDGEEAPPATPEDLRILAQVIVQYLDPDGAEPADDIAMRARGIILGRAKDGVIPIRGGLLPEVAGQLQRIFDAYLNPRVDGPSAPGVVVFQPSVLVDHDEAASTGAVGGTGDDVLPSDDPARMVDTRSRAQKQHDTLAAVLGIAARHDEMPRLGGAAPTLVVTVTADDYIAGRGRAQVDGIDVPVSVRTAAHTACAGGVQRVLFDPAGRIIGIDTSDRIFSAHQRRAITLRDRECLIPSCHVPATWCEIHHVQERSRDGPTHTDNGTSCYGHLFQCPAPV
ncbi:DUF222 domain-containing protein [Microbacterium maritypicum]|uniref:DUF222 domain-containing protein n=1 Tax=Microbacterium maritypicum TaxID=33918 RepID=UPI0037FCD62E